jgi:hypothetical protein
VKLNFESFQERAKAQRKVRAAETEKQKEEKTERKRKRVEAEKVRLEEIKEEEVEKARMEQSREDANQKVDGLLADGLAAELRTKDKAHQKRLKTLLEHMFFTIPEQGVGEWGKRTRLPCRTKPPNPTTPPILTSRSNPSRTKSLCWYSSKGQKESTLLVVRQGTKGIDAPSPDAKNVRKFRLNPKGGPKYCYDYDYNYFESKTAAGVLFNYQLNPAWCEFVFELIFSQLCRRQPDCWFHVPISSAHIDEKPTVRLKTKVVVRYPQRDMDYCLPYVVASCLNCMGHVIEAQRVAATAPDLIYLPGNVVIGRLWTIMQEVLPKVVGQCRIFNKRHGQCQKKQVVLTVNDLIRCKTPYLTVVSPKGVDGSADHAVCVVVFDARLSCAFKLCDETLM